MKLLTLLLLLVTAAISGATLEDKSDACNKEVKCTQNDYKEYIMCLEKKRVKRQTCYGQSVILPPTVPQQITSCNLPNCNVIQNVQPCTGGATYCECINSCSTSCSGYRCGDRCDRSCPINTEPNPQIIYLPVQTIVVQPNQPQINSPNQTNVQPNPPQINPPNQTNVQPNPPQINPPNQIIVDTNPPPLVPSNQTGPKKDTNEPGFFVQLPTTKEKTSEISSLSPNFTTTINLINIVNNTNIVNAPTSLNNTNINNVDLRTNSTGNQQLSEMTDERCCYIWQPKTCEKGPGGEDLCTQRRSRVCGEQCVESSEKNGKNDDDQRCCIVVQPRVCERVNSSKGGVRCVHRKHHTCGEECTSDTIHAQVRQPCNGPPSVCPPQVAYVPQPQPRCSYQPTWPYVSCGSRPRSCEGCYDHYGYGFQQYYGASQPSCGGCYDDGYQPGSLYRQGPFYQPGYYHMPPVNYVPPQPFQNSCGCCGCFGNDRVDPVFGEPSYSPYGASPFYYPPPFSPWPQFPQYPMIPLCFIPPYYQLQQCPLPPIYLPIPYPDTVNSSDPNGPIFTIPQAIPPTKIPSLGEADQR